MRLRRSILKSKSIPQSTVTTSPLIASLIKELVKLGSKGLASLVKSRSPVRKPSFQAKLVSKLQEAANLRKRAERIERQVAKSLKQRAAPKSLKVDRNQRTSIAERQQTLIQSRRNAVATAKQNQIATGHGKDTALRGPKEVESSWVDEIAYIRYGRKLGVAVKFLSGVECFYPGTTLQDYDYLRKASSKGKAIHRRFYDLPYEIVS